MDNSSSQTDPTPEFVLPPSLVWLKRLVTTLTIVMIVGFVLLIGLMFVKMQAAPVTPNLPDHFTLPANTELQSITFSPQWVIVLTKSDNVLVFDHNGGEFLQKINLK